MTIDFFDCSPDQDIPQSGGLTLVIRTDANHATRQLKKNLLRHMSSEKIKMPFDIATKRTDDGAQLLCDYIKTTIHDAYQVWGHEVLKALSEDLNYSKYGIKTSDEMYTNVHFYNAKQLSDEALVKGREMVKETHGPDAKALMISLDDMITSEKYELSEISFSRLFSLCGSQQYDYVARPGYKPIEDQMKDVLEKVKADYAATGKKTPIVLIEDNVRHAKMLNWLVGEMDNAGIFEYADMAGISTCFCCADSEEQSKIKDIHGNSVPVEAVVNYTKKAVDVTTPRDLLFDGFVVQIEENLGRLPGIFMDIESRFKISPDKVDDFREKIRQANHHFCDTIEAKFGVEIPLSWFAVAKPISHVKKACLSTPMKEFFENDEAKNTENNAVNDNQLPRKHEQAARDIAVKPAP
ncbi:MAG: hypothetical protein CL565_04800 [Alphaproteobacteria bacterium]|nr:hypothetical protein [Alphaproteobacteria bacterium]